jgi:D-proline reductase (dithiol) PrdB
VGLVARIVEQAGIPTVVVSTARDITQQVKPPRAVFVNHPMGNTFGRAGDRVLQSRILREALGMVASETEAGKLIDLPHVWDAPIEYRPKKRAREYQLQQ